MDLTTNRGSLVEACSNEKKGKKMKTAIAAATCVLMASAASAQDMDWKYALTAYLWTTKTGVSAETPTGETVEAELSFSDALKDLDFAFMGAFEARKGKWAFLFDGIYTKISGSATAEAGAGGPSVNGALALRQKLFSGALAYRLPAEAVALDLLAGLRYNHLDANLTLSSGPAALATGVGTGWTDPFVGLRLRLPLNRQWTLTGYGDVGGFDPGSDLSWQASIGLRYAISGQFTADFGYRILKSEYETGGFLYDMRNDGLYAGVGIGF